ncbi:FAD-dependent oxidoreductase [Rhizobium sp. RU36D]|uniref:NAD(P)/FAD-dependent oxidoreductase n=1 Tax=Rhizobium sp. RU36D TaxID=1907415 RepID=UPI0009D8F7E4|nr:FAD-dependent oxidoreductase [Rhizobium sp. RU36D]SMC76119.1 3-phenylpropionate/trans-cinnamate dioxygenase ferredoxin reductase subunit [Rhizobium sp. RU36D]
MTPDSSNGVVIIGTGQGGFQLAACLRQEGFEGPITMIGDEPGLPYQRPPLSKAYLKDGRVETIQLRPGSFYERNAIRMMVPERAIRIDREQGLVETLTGGLVDYDHLVLATGARNAVPPIPGLDAANIFGLRTSVDADRLRDRLAVRRRIVVIGGGFIGLEFAAVAISGSHDVTVVEAASRLMARAISPAMSEHFRRFHEALGTRIVLGTGVAEVILGSDGAAHGVRLTDGTELPCDMILLAAGVRPNVELAQTAGLTVDNGIVVDSTLLTDDPAISALGDCAAFPDPVGGSLIRLESVQAASDQARLIARRLTGKHTSYDAVPWFWSDQADWKLQIAGLGTGADEDVAVEQIGARKLVFRFKMGQLLAVETINSAGEHMAARQLLRRSQPITRAMLEEWKFDLGGLAKALKELS